MNSPDYQQFKTEIAQIGSLPPDEAALYFSALTLLIN